MPIPRSGRDATPAYHDPCLPSPSSRCFGAARFCPRLRCSADVRRRRAACADSLRGRGCRRGATRSSSCRSSRFLPRPTKATGREIPSRRRASTRRSRICRFRSARLRSNSSPTSGARDLFDVVQYAPSVTSSGREFNAGNAESAARHTGARGVFAHGEILSGAAEGGLDGLSVGRVTDPPFFAR